MKRHKAKAKVTTMWLVAVKPPGIIPKALHKIKKINSEKISGAYFNPLSPQVPDMVLVTISYSNSLVACIRFIRVTPSTPSYFRLYNNPSTTMDSIERTINSPEFVSEMSIPSKLILMIGFIANCFSGSSCILFYQFFIKKYTTFLRNLV